jgi:methyl-accepting chemotaxis protein
MTLADFPSAGMYIDFAIGVIVLLILFYEVYVQQRNKIKIRELEQKIEAVQQAEEETSANLDSTANALKEVLFEKPNPLTKKLNELSQKANAMQERNETLRQELERQVAPLRESLDDTTAQFNSSHDALRKTVQEGKNEIERMAKEVHGFAEEIQKMKEFIRDGAIDLEL